MKFNSFILKRKVQLCGFSQLVKNVFSCHFGKIFVVIEECRSCWTSFPNQPSPPLVLPGPLIGGFLHPFRDGILMFTGEGRCRDRISPAFGSVVNALVILGHVLGFWSVYSSTLSPHALPAPTAVPLTQPKGYIWYQNTPNSEFQRSRTARG